MKLVGAHEDIRVLNNLPHSAEKAPSFRHGDESARQA